ncbi:hypothetical protein HanHA89_Chr17g0696221 [Helianthus annuus]|nr:hypothetical protein HanHA89_Chr17g0696221 [Helianthus annuus]
MLCSYGILSTSNFRLQHLNKKHLTEVMTTILIFLISRRWQSRKQAKHPFDPLRRCGFSFMSFDSGSGY